MYQRLNSIDVHRNIKSYTTVTFILNCILLLFICLTLAIIALALLPLYLPFHNFIPADLDNNNILPTRSNTSVVFIDDTNWSIVEQTIQNLFNLKLNNIQFTDISDVRIIDSISTSWCNPNGCLRILGKVVFSIDCSLVCQLRKMNKIETLNLIEPPISMNFNSTLNISYMTELDAFTIVVSEDEENGDQVKMFLLYNLMENQARVLSSISVSVDNSSLINITRLVTNSIIQSDMNINEFIVLQADVIIELSMLNVTVLFIFPMECMSDCQEIEVNKLENITSISFDSIVIVYDGKVHFHNVSLFGVFLATSSVGPISTTENTMGNITLETTSLSMIDMTESIFEVYYKLETFDLIINGDLELGPITDHASLEDLTDMMQTTIFNYSNIIVVVFNATIDIDHENSTTKIQSSDSINYILRLIVYYIYAKTCDECIRISNDAVYSEPQLNKFIQIRNATIFYISLPILVINISPNQITTSILSTSTVSLSTIPFLTTDSGGRYSTEDKNTIEATSSSSIHTIIHLTTSQHQITEHTSTIFYSSETTTHHTTEDTTHHTTETTIHHTTVHHTTEDITHHTTGTTAHHTTEATTHHTTEDTTHHTTEDTTNHTTEDTTHHTTETTTHHTTEDTTHHTSEHTTNHPHTSSEPYVTE